MQMSRTFRKLEALERLGLYDGQFFACYVWKNLQWFLDDVEIGCGDLSGENILNIALDLKEGETFVGFFEGTGTFFTKHDNRSVACIIRHQNINLAVR